MYLFETSRYHVEEIIGGVGGGLGRIIGWFEMKISGIRGGGGGLGSGRDEEHAFDFVLMMIQWSMVVEESDFGSFLRSDRYLV